MMPFSGVATFAAAPQFGTSGAGHGECPHFAVFGLPFDCAVGYRPGQRLAPRAIRDASTRYGLPWGRGNPGYWDIEDGREYLVGCRLVDAGDVDPLYFDLEELERRTEALVGPLVEWGVVPIGLGGDHSVTYPMLRPFARLGRPLDIVQIDAHLDFSDDVGGFRRSNSSPLRRAAELSFLGGITVLGVRGVRTSREAYRAAAARGNHIVRASEGLAAMLDALPSGRDVYITLDVDGLDPAFAPGTSSPEPGGLSYGDVRAILQRVAAENRIVGADVVEVNPYLDPTGVTSLLAARLAIELMAYAHADRRMDTSDSKA